MHFPVLSRQVLQFLVHLIHSKPKLIIKYHCNTFLRHIPNTVASSCISGNLTYNLNNFHFRCKTQSCKLCKCSLFNIEDRAHCILHIFLELSWIQMRIKDMFVSYCIFCNSVDMHCNRLSPESTHLGIVCNMCHFCKYHSTMNTENRY